MNEMYQVKINEVNASLWTQEIGVVFDHNH